MGKFALWIIALGVVVAMLGGRGSKPATVAPVAAVTTPEVAEVKPDAAGNGFADVTLTRAADGHFYADAMINGASVRVMVDTGASSIALTRADAQAAGVQFSSGDFTGVARTAGGDVALKPVMLDRVAIGPVEARGVEAVIIDSDLSVTLLGQSWLRRVGKVEISGDKMVLR